MSINDDIHRQLFDKVNALTESLAKVRGEVAAQNEINGDLVKLLKRALSYEFWTIIVLIAALVYGAIGKDGLFAVRQAVSAQTAMTDGDRRARPPLV